METKTSGEESTNDDGRRRFLLIDRWVGAGAMVGQQEPLMPWSVVREGREIHVRITSPIGDWRPLVDRVHDEIQWNPYGTRTARLPSQLPGASAFELAVLEILRQMLSEAGITVRSS